MSAFGVLWSMWKYEILFYLGLMLLVLFYPYRFLVELILLVCVSMLLFKLWKDHRNFKKPVFKEWAWMVFNTSIVLVVLWYLQKWLGNYGVLGLIVLVLGLALWRVWRGRKLFNAFTTWSADRLKGRTKEEFEFKEEYK